MKKIFLPTFVCFAFSCLPSFATAAMITGGSITSNVEAPGSGGVSNSVGAQVSAELLKFVGDINLTTTSGGSSLGNSLVIEGNVSLDPGDAFTLAYDYDVQLTGGGTVSLTTTAITDFGGVTETLTNTELITEPGSFNFKFSDLAVVASNAVSGTWVGRFEFDWMDATADSSLNIVIPNDSIDFAITAVPEPTVMGTMFAASLVMATRRRRRNN